jgi:deazaflavin-dependent oxidoreductase (nitroreductase family)
MTGAVAYPNANVFQRLARRFAGSAFGSWLFARLLHRIDRPIFRLTRGRHTFTSLASGLPVVMLTTTGARSGKVRTVPVLGLPTEGGIAVIASNWGQRDNPGWYYNLCAHPEGEASVNGETYPFQADEAEGDERSRIWESGVRIYPGWPKYERRASNRRIHVFVLRRA